MWSDHTSTPGDRNGSPAGLARAQLHAWALLPTLTQWDRDREAAAHDVALTEHEADPIGQAPGRFGFDEPELTLHQAEAHLPLGRTEQARTRAEDSAAACTPGTPGGAAATLVLAQAAASDQPSDDAQRALDVLSLVPPSRLRTTAHTRLGRLDGPLAARAAQAETPKPLCQTICTAVCRPGPERASPNDVTPGS
ncbi:hypothetical protein [Streptomyces sp. HUAS TT20]|uniref:hypothetical protein n=1 Tax=Streptomyces sp. HUAS TT20 TaxID=3447509 RepID=UPI0021D7E874|nr:hypothetical protein [Streptomyces sp. HUAS 15-9]UXY25198.1 hypothetical protein N8I87_00450 [Streptomyces sp. HUAS 15-9]